MPMGSFLRGREVSGRLMPRLWQVDRFFAVQTIANLDKQIAVGLKDPCHGLLPEPKTCIF